MKSKVLFGLMCFLLAVTLQSTQGQESSENRRPVIPLPRLKQPVLVELFTSEGCPNCPPADRALRFLQKEQPNSQAEIITLAFHVDYLEDSAWKDEFSSPLFTQRQQFYAWKFRLNASYTPQLIVDGTYQLVGSDLKKAGKAIAESLKMSKPSIELAKIENSLQVDIPETFNETTATVYLAIAEDDLPSKTFRGSYGGENIIHISVVRQLKILGKIEQGESRFTGMFPLDFDPVWKPRNLKFVVFVQENQSRRILAVNTFKFS